MKSIIFSIGLLIFTIVSCSTKTSSSQNSKPNIILIMLDDLGYECIQSYGGTSYNTPNIDKLAATGMQFNNAYAQPLCTPTRIELMTGKYNFRNWTAFGILHPEEKTFGHLMQKGGYNTCIVGKWQLQSYDPLNYPGSENRRDKGMKVSDAGFDEYSLWHTGHTEDKGSRYANPTIFENGFFLKNTQGLYGPDLFSDYLNEFVNKQKDKPFFVYYPMALTHDPFSPTPDSDAWQEENKRMVNDPVYFKDMVQYADKILGKIIKNLEEKGIRDETLILFYSDNGTHQKITSKLGPKEIKGGKALSIETGIKVPFIANWPGKIKPGTKTNEYVSAVDFLPTILETAEINIPKSFHTDGQSFLPTLKGQKTDRRDWVFIGYNPKPGAGKDHLYPADFVLNSNYKLYADERFFNTQKDYLELSPLQKNNLSSKETKLKNKYKKILDSLVKYPRFGFIERLDAGLDKVLSKHAKIELVADGFNWSEGPVWLPKEQTLVFSDVPENKIYAWNEKSGLELYMSPSGYTGTDKNITKGSNGLTLDAKGNLILCQVGDKRISKLVNLSKDKKPVFNTIVDNYKGKKFNSPNDLVYDQHSNLYFTDPAFGLGKKKSELGFNGVYFFSQSEGIKLLDKSIQAPNGIAVSPDGKTLYIADSHKTNPSIWAYDIIRPGVVKNKRMFFNATALRNRSIDKQRPDGIKIDNEGNLFVAGPGGVLIIAPTGKHLGTIRLDKKTGNCEFTADKRYLFITCDDYLLRVYLKPYDK